MNNLFFEHPILNSPYLRPEKHWELDSQGQPTQKILEFRRPAEFITPIPKPRKQQGKQIQLSIELDAKAEELSQSGQRYTHSALINELRNQVESWRKLPNPGDWKVTPETARLLHHWRQHEFSGIRPFFVRWRRWK